MQFSIDLWWPGESPGESSKAEAAVRNTEGVRYTILLLVVRKRRMKRI